MSDKKQNEQNLEVKVYDVFISYSHKNKDAVLPIKSENAVRFGGWRESASICRILFGSVALSVAAVFAVCLACSAAQAQGPVAVGNVPGTNSVAGAVRKEGISLRAENEALRAENEALRRENQMLRRELISKNGALPDSLMPEKGVASEPEIEPAGEDTGYWISAKSKVRHNRRCRNYRKVKGRPCGPTDGRPCKTCGG